MQTLYVHDLVVPHHSVYNSAKGGPLGIQNTNSRTFVTCTHPLCTNPSADPLCTRPSCTPSVYKLQLDPLGVHYKVQTLAVPTLCSEGASGTLDDATVRLVQRPHLQHLILVLDEQLDALDGRRRRLRDDGRRATQSKVLRKPKLIALRHLKDTQPSSVTTQRVCV